MLERRRPLRLVIVSSLSSQAGLIETCRRENMSSLRLALKRSLEDAPSMLMPPLQQNLTTLEKRKRVKHSSASAVSTLNTKVTGEMRASVATISLNGTRATVNTEGNAGVTPTTPKPDIKVVGGCSLRLAIKKSIEESQHLQPTSLPLKLSALSADENDAAPAKRLPAAVSASPNCVTSMPRCQTMAGCKSVSKQRSLIYDKAANSSNGASIAGVKDKLVSATSPHLPRPKSKVMSFRAARKLSLTVRCKAKPKVASPIVPLIGGDKSAYVIQPRPTVVVEDEKLCNPLTYPTIDPTVLLKENSQPATATKKTPSPLEAKVKLSTSAESMHVKSISKTNKMIGSKSSTTHHTRQITPSPSTCGSVTLNEDHNPGTVTATKPHEPSLTSTRVTPKIHVDTAFRFKLLPGKKSPPSTEKAPSWLHGAQFTTAKSNTVKSIISQTKKVDGPMPSSTNHPSQIKLSPITCTSMTLNEKQKPVTATNTKGNVPSTTSAAKLKGNGQPAATSGKESSPLERKVIELLTTAKSYHVKSISSQTKKVNRSRPPSTHYPSQITPSSATFGSVALNGDKTDTAANTQQNVPLSTSASIKPKTNTIPGFKPSPTKNSFTGQQTLNNPKGAMRTVSTPMLYVGITLERPESLKSWGLVFTKQRANHVVVIRVVDPPDGHKRPAVKWCGVTNSVPNASVVYRTATTPIMSLDKYEPFIIHNFPSTCDGKHFQNTGLLNQYLNPGDAIISINGLPVSAFPTIGHFASYIRSNCARKMTVVAHRHERVWEAALGQMIEPGGTSQNNQAVTDRVSKAVRDTWMRVLPPSGGILHQAKRKAMPHPTIVKRPKIEYIKRPKIEYMNSMFRDKDGKPIKYCDNDESERDDDKQIQNFVNDEIEKTFDEWLQKRKASWRERRPRKHVCHVKEVVVVEDELTVGHEFWLATGHESFNQWLSTSKTKWTRSYSWHKEKRQALQSECEREVHFPTVESHAMLGQFENWLTVRKQQWRLERRKLQRQRAELSDAAVEDEKACPLVPLSSEDCSSSNNEQNTSATNSNQYWDEILEDQERLTKEEIVPAQPMDISWVFNSQLGAPDDIIVNVMTYLRPCDHGNLLCLSFTTNYLFKQRDVMWRSLCPKHWIVPRRPRKSWCAMYITKIRAEEEASRKQSDDLLVKANIIIEKGDQLTKLERVIRKAVKDFQFSVNYISCVVLERNSLLNLAVIDKRHRITKWLIDKKDADIETCDRGHFTPLINAAWNGDKYIVRYLLGKGCDRTKVGYNHSSRGLAPATFNGLDAEGWARKRGHDEVAELIRLGL